jgi:multidrug/hemolysin transport system permease protein
MSPFISLVKRNIYVYIRSTNTVMFSLLGLIIVIAVFLLIGDSIIGTYKELLPGKDVTLYVYQWLAAGLVAITTMIVPMGVLGNVSRDKSNNVMKDFLIAPVSTYKLAMSYVTAAFVMGMVISLIVFAAAVALLFALSTNGVAAMPAIKNLPLCIGMIALSTILNSEFMFMIVTFVHKYTTFTSINVAMNVVIGFITGVAVPIGTLGIFGALVKICGSSYPVAFLRRMMMSEEIYGEGMERFRIDFGVDLSMSFDTFGTEFFNNGGIVAITVLFVAVLTIFVFIRVRNTRRIRYGR